MFQLGLDISELALSCYCGAFIPRTCWLAFQTRGGGDERAIPRGPHRCALLESPVCHVLGLQAVSHRKNGVGGRLWRFVPFKTWFGMRAPRPHAGWRHWSPRALLVKSLDWWAKLTNSLGQSQDAFERGRDVIDPFSNSLVIKKRL